MREKWRLAYVVSHPIQYQAPLLRRINAEPDIDLYARTHIMNPCIQRAFIPHYK